MVRHGWRVFAMLMVASCGALRAASAQNPPPPPRPDSLSDTLRTRVDTSDTERLLQGQAEELVILPIAPLPGINTLLPPGSRVVFTRDSIDRAPALTVSELLQRLDEVYPWRAGWRGLPDIPNYQGHGAAAVEYVLDGVPQQPLGDDSLAFDPSHLALNNLEMVVVDRGPGMARVEMFSRRHDRLAPRTAIAVATGDRGYAEYRGAFERRFRSGIGLSLMSDFFNVDAPQGGSGASQITNSQFQLGWIPTPRYGVQAQVQFQTVDRDTLVRAIGVDGAIDTLLPRLNGNRTDAQLRGFWRARTDGLGRYADAFLVQSTWRGDDSHHSSSGIGLIVGQRAATWSAQATGWYRSLWTPVDARVNLGWAPLPWLSASLETVAQSHENDRSSLWETGRIGLRGPFGTWGTATVRNGRRVQSPADLTDTPQRFTDVEARGGIDLGWIAADAAVVRTDAWRPQIFQQFRRIPALLPMQETNWTTVHARFQPRNWFTLESSYENPFNVLPDGAPPHHAYTTATIKSRFLRNFPSGIFELKVQAVIESWSPGAAGRDTSGAVIRLPGNTQSRAIIQFKLGPFFVYYDRVNLKGSRVGYVPGYIVPGLATTYGVRWEFHN